MNQEAVRAIMLKGPVIPVVVIERLEEAVPLAKALLEGGIEVIEVTLRTEVGLDAIREIAAKVPGMTVGAGTVLDGDQFEKAKLAGAEFIVSPGAEESLLDRAEKADLPLLPGAVTPSEIMALRRRGYKHLKFFPAENYGGVKTLKSLAGPFKDIYFCPTGGISSAKAGSYHELDQVLCVGGSWITPSASLEDRDWTTITELARAANSL